MNRVDIGRVVVCIVAFRNPADVIRCLAALDQQHFEGFEVVVCENGGPEAMAELKANTPGQLSHGQFVTVIADHSNPGYAGGVNRCVALRPQADAYWILNPDTAPPPEVLCNLVSELEHGLVDAVGGPVYLPNGRLRTCGGHWNRWLAYSRSIAWDRPLDQCPGKAEVEQRLSFISGASLLCTRHFLDVAGTMREDYFLYGEEVEWCLRAKRSGLNLGFCREAAVLHYQGTTTGTSSAISEQSRLPLYCDERNRILTLRDTEPWPVVTIGIFGALAVIAWRYAHFGAWRAMRHALEGWWDGLCNRRGKPAWLTATGTSAT